MSTFVRTNRAPAARMVSTVIQFQKAYAACDSQTGEVSIQWPDNAAIVEGVLGEEIFSSGATKNVHEVRTLLRCVSGHAYLYLYNSSLLDPIALWPSDSSR